MKDTDTPISLTNNNLIIINIEEKGLVADQRGKKMKRGGGRRERRWTRSFHNILSPSFSLSSCSVEEEKKKRKRALNLQQPPFFLLLGASSGEGREKKGGEAVNRLSLADPLPSPRVGEGKEKKKERKQGRLLDVVGCAEMEEGKKGGEGEEGRRRRGVSLSLLDGRGKERRVQTHLIFLCALPPSLREEREDKKQSFIKRIWMKEKGGRGGKKGWKDKTSLLFSS